MNRFWRTLIRTTPLGVASAIASLCVFVIGWWWAKASFVATNSDPWWYSTWVVVSIFVSGAICGAMGRPRILAMLMSVANLGSAVLFAPWKS
jgi:hypothetical protein